MELFDLVNLENQNIGVTNKIECHNKGLLHRVIAIFVFNQMGELLVQHHKSDGKLDHSVGGHVSKGENFISAAIRECDEELNLICKPIFLTLCNSDETFTGQNIRHIFAIYEHILSAEWSFNPTKEVKKIEFIDINKLLKLIQSTPWLFKGGFINTLEKYLKVKNISHHLDFNHLKNVYLQ